MSNRHKKLPVAVLERIDDACIEFENAWQRGQPLPIEAVLERADTADEREALLAELLTLDFDYRKKRGEQPDVRTYRELFPEDAGLVERALDDCMAPTGTRRFEPPTTAQLAKLFPALEIIQLIGAGGMGAVYKARQKGLDRLVALKILPDEVSHDVKFALRFTREARALARLNHPQIVSVFEFGNEQGTYYFLMEYVDGSNLRDVIRAGQLNPVQALKIVPLLCEALQYAHDQGVVHRDIKPENILMDKNGQVKIADFGLSRLLGNESNEEVLTGTHQVMGTLRYMAPEQMEGAHKVDHRADIYSLGVVFYEMLTGELPIGRFALPSKKVHIDVRLDDVVLRTLEKEPQLRYQHASDVKSDLESIANTADRQISSGATTQAIDPSQIEQSRRPTSLADQEMAGRVALLRRDMISRVSQSLRPLFWGQLTQVAIGLVFIAIGVLCWSRSQDITHRFVSGIVIHVYGVLLIIAGAATCGKIGSMDLDKPVDQVRNQLRGIRNHYLRAGGLIGFAWWLIWIPFAVAIGFDAVMYPGSFGVSVVTGVIGFVVSLGLYIKVLRADSPAADKWKKSFNGKSLNQAYLALDDLAQMEEH